MVKMMSWLQLRLLWAERVPSTSFALFRIFFGFLTAYEIDYKLKVGKHHELVEPELHFTFLYFDWIQPGEQASVLALHYGIIALSCLVALGLFYRVAVVALWASLSAYFMMEQALYINHVYLYCLFAGILCVSPAHSALSLDRYLGFRWFRPKEPGVIPRYSLHLMRLQMTVVYTFAGIAKMNPDWLRGVPLNRWLPPRADGSVFGSLLESYEVALAMSYGGLLFDTLVGTMLLWRRTRLFAFFWACCFHLTNANIFGVASFPWVSIVTSTLFFAPDWPERLLQRFVDWQRVKRHVWVEGAARRVRGFFGAARGGRAGLLNQPLSVVIAAYCIFQLLFPLRHWLYEGNVAWTEEGHRFSWRMMLRSKSGKIRFYAVDPETGERRKINPRDFLTKRQTRKMSTKPDMILQFAHFVAEKEQSAGRPKPQVFADVIVSLNGRKRQRMVDLAVDLAAEPRHLRHQRWLLPFEWTDPLSDRR